MHSLRFKILVIAAVLVVLTQAGTIGTVLVTANRAASTRAESDLATGATLFKRLMDVRATGLRNFIRAAAASRRLSGVIASGDPQKVGSVLATLGQRVGADLALVLDATGGVIATTNTITPEFSGTDQLIHRAEIDGFDHTTISLGQKAWEMITVPVTSSDRPVWISMGFIIDDALARSMQRYTGLDVTLVMQSADAPIVLGSSVARIGKTDNSGLSSGHAAPSRGTIPLTIAGARSLALRIPYMPNADNISVLLHKSLFDAMAPYRLLRAVVITLGIITLIVGLGGALLLSATVTRPLKKLSDAARRISVGDYGVPIKDSGHGDLAELARAFNAMQQAIAEREEHITYQAQFDALTGLPNRILGLNHLQEVIEKVSDTGEPVSIMLIDLDSFDEIGSSLGHEFSDALLCQVAARLRASLDSQHTLARLEADEFLIVMRHTDLEAAQTAAGELLRTMQAGLAVRDINITLDANIGISAFPDHGKDPDQLLLRAAVAKNDAKQTQQSLHIYEEGKETCHLRQLAILGDLRRAVRNDELKLFLQPKIHLGIGAVCGAEALVRWEHPTLGFLTPGEFIPIAEKSGNITLITHWALAAAIRECRLW